jgi:hypothetical protein
MEELSKQLSTELNEPITVHQVEGSWIKVEGEDNKYCMNSRTAVLHRFIPTNIHNNELLFWLEDPKIHLFCNSKCDITTIMQMYNETREYKNSLNKEFNLDCEIRTFYNDNNVIDEVIIHISTEDDNISEYIVPIYGKTYLECYEKINKIITLKNELLAKYGTIEESENLTNSFVLNINNNDSIILEFSLYDGGEYMIFKITVATNKLIIHEVYNQFKNYINSFIEKCEENDDFHDRYVDSSIYIDMSYKDGNSNIDVEISGNYLSTITIKSESKNIDFSVVSEIYNEVINYLGSVKCHLQSRIYYYSGDTKITVKCADGAVSLNKITEVNIIYNSSNLINICATYNMVNICADNYIEFTEKLEVINFEQKKLLEQDRLQKEQEKQKLEQERIIKEQHKFKKSEEDIKKIALELSTQFKEDIIINEFTNNSFIILGEASNTEYKIKINVKYYNIINVDISKIYNEIRTFRNNNDLHKKYQFDLYIETDYTNNFANKIILKWDDNEISGQNYFECSQKIAEYIKVNQITLTQKLGLKIKEEQEKFATKLKLKYGEKTLVTNSNHYATSSIYLVISNVDTQHIDLLDIIYYYSGNRIVNGFIKQINCANYEKYINSNIDKSIFNITIQNCPNLKIINNIIDFENNAHLKICNCPKLEFIQNYNNFSEIYIDNHKVKIFNE